MITEDQAFSPSYDLPPSPVGKLDWRHTERLRKRDNLLTGEGEDEGFEGEAKPYVGEKAWSSINHSTFSANLSSRVLICISINSPEQLCKQNISLRKNLNKGEESAKVVQLPLIQ
jgi:hypothetical protein